MCCLACFICWLNFVQCPMCVCLRTGRCDVSRDMDFKVRSSGLNCNAAVCISSCVVWLVSQQYGKSSMAIETQQLLHQWVEYNNARHV